MLHNKTIACIIPARLNSSRLPQKMLKSIANKPILQWVWEAACKISFFDTIIIATDAQEIVQLVNTFNGKAILTSPTCPSGTDRLVELMQNKKITANIWVNWQGDEPFINSTILSNLLQSIHTDTSSDMWTLKKRITDPQQVLSPNTAKVVCDNTGYALYFSRSPIPFYRDAPDKTDIKKLVYYKHVGIYAYTYKGLQKIAQMPPQSELESAEKLEQLRFLQNGFRIKLHETTEEVKGIDTPEDILQAEELLARSHKAHP
jgi:3-deoxy-manno-octulosonate cytidylyltransferase (CMP-KDO synthetase)